jgi:hypothetical protein
MSKYDRLFLGISIEKDYLDRMFDVVNSYDELDNNDKTKSKPKKKEKSL